jgi:hypothetical protein
MDSGLTRYARASERLHEITLPSFRVASVASEPGIHNPDS